MAWCAIKLRLDCQECGSSVVADGPHAHIRCEACGARIAMSKKWGNIVEHALHHGTGGKKYALVAAIDSGPKGLGMRYMALSTGHPPVCPTCEEVLDEAEHVAEGTKGSFFCPACGSGHPTWPAPNFLRQVGVRQVFMAPPEGANAVTKETDDPKLIVFQCPNCGANLKITEATKRISTCRFCDVDTFLPATLWNKLHPIRRRRAFWLRMKVRK